MVIRLDIENVLCMQCNDAIVTLNNVRFGGVQNKLAPISDKISNDPVSPKSLYRYKALTLALKTITLSL